MVQIFQITEKDLENLALKIVEEVRGRIDEKKPSENERYLSIEEVTKLIGVDQSTLWRWEKKGYLRKIRVGGSVRYRKSDLEKILEGRG